MKVWTLLAAVILLLIAGTPALAEVDQVAEFEVAAEVASKLESDLVSPSAELEFAADPASEFDAANPTVAWEDFDAAEFVPGTPSATPADVEPVKFAARTAHSAAEFKTAASGVQLGPVGVDSAGQIGRVHTVQTGDTLWDISRTYLGTAWVWPSVWNENSEIENPHLIEPGERIWITSTEMRAVSDDEADALVAQAETLDDSGHQEVASKLSEDLDPAGLDEFPAAEDEFAEASDIEYSDELSEGMNSLSVGMPDDGGRGNETGREIRVSMRENLSFVSDTQLQAATSIVASVGDRINLALLDTIYLGAGEGEVAVGDEFTIFRNLTSVYSPSTKRFLGYHVEVLGWAEVTEVTAETSVAVIQVSISEAIIGDRVMPRYRPPVDIAVKHAEEGIEGEVAFLPGSRTLMGTSDYVFLDVGAVHGVEIGTDMEVYDAGQYKYDNTRDKRVRTPDRVVADLVVITVQEESSVAFVAHTRRELAVGDFVRGATRSYPEAF